MNSSPVVRREREERRKNIEIATRNEEQRLRIEEPNNKIPAKEGLKSL